MTREFLKNLGLEDAAIDNILNENMADIGKEKAKTTAAKADLADAQGKLAAAQSELETLKKAGGRRSAAAHRAPGQVRQGHRRSSHPAGGPGLRGRHRQGHHRQGAQIQLQERGAGVHRRAEGAEAGAEGRRAHRPGRLHQGPEGGGPGGLRAGQGPAPVRYRRGQRRRPRRAAGACAGERPDRKGNGRGQSGQRRRDQRCAEKLSVKESTNEVQNDRSGRYR